MRHYSPSQLRQFLRCPRQWAYRYLEKLVCPPGVALVVGGAVHVPAGEYHLRGMRLAHEWTPDAAGRQMTAEEAADLARDAFGKLAEGRDPSGEYPDGPPVNWAREEEERGQATDRAVAMARKYLTEVAPACGRPVSVEEKKTISLDGEAFQLVCKPDVVIALPNNSEYVRDLKTGARAPNGASRGAVEVDDDARRQLVFYHYARRVETGSDPEGAGIDFVWTNKDGARSTHAVVAIDHDDYAEAFGQLRAMDKSIRDGNFIKNTSHNMCGPRWCGYFSLCRPHRVLVPVGVAI